MVTSPLGRVEVVNVKFLCENNFLSYFLNMESFWGKNYERKLSGDQKLSGQVLTLSCCKIMKENLCVVFFVSNLQLCVFELKTLNIWMSLQQYHILLGKWRTHEQYHRWQYVDSFIFVQNSWRTREASGADYGASRLLQLEEFDSSAVNYSSFSKIEVHNLSQVFFFPIRWGTSDVLLSISLARSWGLHSLV